MPADGLSSTFAMNTEQVPVMYKLLNKKSNMELTCRLFCKQLHLTHLLLQDGAQRFTTKKLEPAEDFLQKSVALGIPANTIIFLDTHSCANTGYLQYGGGRTNAKVVGLGAVFICFLPAWLDNS
jgi:hypothetical protein